MRKKSILILSLCFQILSFLFCETSIEYEKRISNVIQIFDVHREFNFNYTDSRKFQENKIDITTLLSELDLNKNSKVNSLSIEPIKIEFDFSFFGFYRTGSGTWIGKSIIHCKIIDLYNLSYNEIKTLTTEIVFKKKRRLKQSLFDKWSTELVQKVKLKINDYLNNYINNANDRYKSVISFGKYKITDSEEETLKLAKLDALRQGCIKAWGLQLESTTTLIDLADVEEKTTSTTKGLIVKYKLLDKYTKKTEDNYLCILLQSIILNPYNK